MEKINLLKVGTEKNQLQLNLSSFNDMPLLELRNYYLNKEGDEMLPTKKGISLSKDKYLQIKKNLNDNDELIIDHFSGCNILSKLASKEGEKKQALSTHAHGVKKVSYKFNNLKNNNDFLQTQYKGSEVLISINSSSKIGADLEEIYEQHPEIFTKFCNFIAAYEVSKIISLSGMEEDYSFVSEYMKHDFNIIYNSITNAD